MTAPVKENDSTDIELRANFQLLKNFVDTMVVMNEMVQSNIQPNEAVKSALKMAVEFMITIPNYTNLSVMNKIIVYLNRNIEYLSTDFALINSTVMSNKYQTSSQIDAYVITISLCDRLTIPKSKAVVSNPNAKVIAEQNRTPNILESRIASFINIDTPVSLQVENYENITVSMEENSVVVPESLKRKDSYKRCLISLISAFVASGCSFDSVYNEQYKKHIIKVMLMCSVGLLGSLENYTNQGSKILLLPYKYVERMPFLCFLDLFSFIVELCL
ncbi:unnamed protein product [Onchocerca flexuosa]|uniref:Transmembrane protein n=1 Tax=Onchocerca flexuosa TaxID=387005 RepID=A0A183I1Z0_9BILA|nr:unnamed protein product [Onchocerca flexuosa]